MVDTTVEQRPNEALLEPGSVRAGDGHGQMKERERRARHRAAHGSEVGHVDGHVLGAARDEISCTPGIAAYRADVEAGIDETIATGPP